MPGERILLVDDEQDFAQILAERLQARGFDVEIAASGITALRKARRETFDVVVLDMVMPVMDGIETLKHLREEHPDLHVIMLTGHATVERTVEAMKLGAMDFIEKPAELEDLLRAIGEGRVHKTAHVEQEMRDRIDDILRSKGW